MKKFVNKVLPLALAAILIVGSVSYWQTKTVKAAVGLVSNNYTDPGSTGGTSATINTTGATLLIVIVASSGQVPTVSDSQGNTWLAIASVNNNFSIFYAYQHSGGALSTSASHTTTLTTPAGGYPCWSFSAWSGTDTTGPLDTNNAVAGTYNPGTFSLGNLAPANNGELLIVGTAEDNTRLDTTISNESGAFTKLLPTTNVASFNHTTPFYEIQTTATSRNPSITPAAVDVALGQIVAFKAAAAAATATTPTSKVQNMGKGYNMGKVIIPGS